MPRRYRDALRLLAALLLLAGGGAACGRPASVGEERQVVVAATEPVWRELGPDLRAALERRHVGVREERAFELSRVDPRAAEWRDFRRLRQVLVIGAPTDPWVARALDAAGQPIPDPPAIVPARNVWARPQQVTVLLLPRGGSASAHAPLARSLGSLYDRRLRARERARMFSTGADSALADSLRAAAGFALVVPKVYRHAEVRPGVFVFRNDQPDPSRLLRQVVVTRLSRGERPGEARALLRARAALARDLTFPPQVTDTTIRALGPAPGPDPGVEIRGVWSNPPGEFPAAGPFITRAVPCPGGVFLLDAWLYAPGQAKYPYLVQLETVLDSFRCARSGPSPGG